MKKTYLDYLERYLRKSEGTSVITEPFHNQEVIVEDIQEMSEEVSEKMKCKLYGIPCSYGICSECEEYKSDNLHW